VVALKRPYGAVAGPGGGNAFYGGGGSGCCRDVGYFVSNSRFANVRVIVFAEFACRGVDYKLDFAVLDGVNDVGSAFVHFKDAFGFDAFVCEEAIGSFGGLDFEAQLLKFFCDGHDSGFVRVGYRDKDRALRGQGLVCGLLGFEEGQREGVGHSEHFAGRAHLRPEDGVNLREHIKWEDGFLYAEVRYEAVLYVEVGKFFAEHKLNGDADHRNVAYL